MSTHNDPGFEQRFGAVIRSVLDADNGPHPSWSDAPAARRIAAGEARLNRFPRPPLRMLALAAVLVVGGAAAAVGAYRLTDTKPVPTLPVPSLPVAIVATPAPARNGWIAFEPEDSAIAITKPGEDTFYIHSVGSSHACPQFGKDGLLAVADDPTQPNEFRSDVTTIRLPNAWHVNASGYERVDSIDINQRALDAGDCFEWSPDGNYVAFTTLLGDDAALTIVGDKLQGIPLNTGRDHPPVVPDSVAWTADGSLLATVHGLDPDGTGENANSTVWVLPPDASAGARKLLETVPGEVINEIAFSPDGTKLAYRGTKLSPTEELMVVPTGTFVRVVDLESGDQLVSLDELDDAQSTMGAGPTWSPDGTQIAWVLGGEVRIGGADGGGWRELPPVSSDELGTGWATDPLIWSADGNQILVGELDEPIFDRGVSTSVVLYDVSSNGQPQSILPWARGGYGRVTWQVLGE